MLDFMGNGNRAIIALLVVIIIFLFISGVFLYKIQNAPTYSPLTTPIPNNSTLPQGGSAPTASPSPMSSSASRYGQPTLGPSSLVPSEGTIPTVSPTITNTNGNGQPTPTVTLLHKL